MEWKMFSSTWIIVFFMMFTLIECTSFHDCFPCHILNRINESCVHVKEDCGRCYDNHTLKEDGSEVCYLNNNQNTEIPVLISETTKRNEDEIRQEVVEVTKVMERIVVVHDDKLFYAVMFVGFAILLYIFIKVFNIKFKKYKCCGSYDVTSVLPETQTQIPQTKIALQSMLD
ncbi:hypothetical protein CHUAL_009003 [Chamberlinius hualienensis]